MATKTYYTPWTYNGDQTARYRIEVRLVESQNTTNNTTTLTCTAWFRPESTSSYAFNSGNTFKLTVNGTVLCNGNPGRVEQNKQIGITNSSIGSSWTTSAIAHNYDGTKTVSIAVYYNQSQNQTLTINASGTVTLTTISVAKVTVTFNKNGGSGGTDSVQMYPNTPAANYPSITRPTRAGYTFAGYYSAASGGTQYFNSSGGGARVFNYSANTTLYAHWTAITGKLYYHHGTAYDGQSGQYYGTAKDGYQLVTFNNQPGFLATSGSSTPIVGNWTAASTTYNAYNVGTFLNPPSGCSTPPEASQWRVWNYTRGKWLNTSGVSAASFDFNTLIGVEGTQYGDTIYFFARWVPNASYTLTIDPNGGTWNGSNSVQAFTQASGTTKAIAAPTRDRWEFVGWAETGPGSLAKSIKYSAAQTNVLNNDPAFDSGNGAITVYNNSANGEVTHTRQNSSANTTIYGAKELAIAVSTGTTTPGLGGFIHRTASSASKIFQHTFVAKLPVGYTVTNAQNATGTGRSIAWYSMQVGTGKYEIYSYKHTCGASGTFSDFGHVYAPSGSKPLTWQLAYSIMTDITNGWADTYTFGAGNGRLTALWVPKKSVWVYHDNAWKRAIPWIYVNGQWEVATAKIMQSSTWKNGTTV